MIINETAWSPRVSSGEWDVRVNGERFSVVLADGRYSAWRGSEKVCSRQRRSDVIRVMKAKSMRDRFGVPRNPLHDPC